MEMTILETVEFRFWRSRRASASGDNTACRLIGVVVLAVRIEVRESMSHTSQPHTGEPV
jgi:hypothetical protein